MKEKKMPQMTLTDVLVFPLIFALTYELIFKFFNAFYYEIGFIYVYLGFFVTATAYIASKRKVNFKAALPPVIAILFLLVSVALHGQDDFFIYSFLMIIYLSGAYCVRLTGQHKNIDGGYFYLLEVMRSEFMTPISNLFLPLRSLRTIKPKKRGLNKKAVGTVLSVLFGVLLAVPVILVVLPLLSEGDLAFQSVTSSFTEMINELYDKIYESEFLGDLDDYLFWCIPAIIVSPYIFSVMFSFRHSVDLEKKEKTPEGLARFRFVSSNVFIGFLGLISVLYLVYLFSQLGYFFSGFLGKLPEEMTVSSYARRGFFEMATVAVINFCIIAVTVIFSKRKSGRLTRLIKGFDFFLSVFTLILVSTSISKIALYIAEMGLTHRRIYVLLIDLVLFVTFASVIIRLFKVKFPYMKVILGFSVSLMCLTALLGVDSVIVKYNTEMYLRGRLETVDVSYIGYINYSLESLDKLAKAGGVNVKKTALAELAEEFYQYVLDSEGTPEEWKKRGMPEYKFTSFDRYRTMKYAEENFERLVDNWAKNGWWYTDDSVFASAVEI